MVIGKQEKGSPGQRVCGTVLLRCEVWQGPQVSLWEKKRRRELTLRNGFQGEPGYKRRPVLLLP